MKGGLLAVGALAWAIAQAGHAAGIPLYPTGPSEDAAFLRFVNAGEGALELAAAGSEARLRLEDGERVSDFLTVPAGRAVKGSLSRGGQRHELDVTVEPGEFTTVVGLPGAGAGAALELATVREQPDDFNALKASLAFYSLDARCADAGLRVAGRSVEIFTAVAEGSVQRRSINPVNLSVQLSCAGAPAGEALALGELRAGERYSVFLVPSSEGPRLFQAKDSLAN